MRTGLLAVFFWLSVSIFAGGDNYYAGARFGALGFTAVSLSDLWSTHHNQAGLAFLTKPSAGIFYEDRFLLKETGLSALAVALPLKKGTFGFAYSSFGYSLYKESKYGISYAQKLGENFGASLQLDYMTFRMGDSYGSRGAITGEVGLRARIYKGLTLGLHVFSPGNFKISRHSEEYIPTVVRAGIDYKFSENVILASEVEKQIDRKLVFRSGIEYRLIKEFFIRAGYATNPNTSTFGIGIELKHFKIDLSSQFHSTLGFTPQAGLSYAF